MPPASPTIAASRARMLAAQADAVQSAAVMLKDFTDSYASGRRTRLNSRPVPQGGSADAHLDWNTRRKQRAACQQLVRVSPVARAIVQRLSDMVIGDGFTCQALTQDTEWNAKAEHLWSEWAVNGADVRGMRSLWQIVHSVMLAMLTDGDLLVVKVAPRGMDDQPCIQLIESELIGSFQMARGGSAPKGKSSNEVFDGVECDTYGRPVRYHVTTFGPNGNAIAKADPIKAEDALYLVNPRGQLVNNTRGEPGLQATLDAIERLDEYLESVAISARIATLLSLIIKTANPAAVQSALQDQAENVTGVNPNSTDPREAYLTPGAFFALKPGESVEQVKPEQPGTNHVEFVMLQIQLIAAELGLPVILAQLDFSRVNFHSAKSALNVARRGFEVWQRFLADRLLVPLYRWRIELAIERKELPANDDWDRVEMVAPPMPIIDFEKEARGYDFAVQANLMTRKYAIGQFTGQDRDAVNAERAFEKKEDRRLGIEPPSVPGSVTPSSPGGDATDPETDAADTAWYGSPQDKPRPQNATPAPVAGAPKKPILPNGLAPSDGKTVYLIGDKTLAADMVESIVKQELPAASAKAILVNLIGLEPDKAEQIVGPTTGFEGPKPTTVTNATPPPGE